MNNVAIYLRKSRDEENEDKEIILKRHETQLLDYCRRNNLIVAKIYREIVSGDTIENRPEMQKLLEDISNKLYDGVVCMEIERLSRGNQIDQVEILETFKASGAKIYTLNKVYDLTNEDIDEEFFEFALFMSRREYKIIKRRMQRGKRQALKDGYFTGSICPYGYDKERIGRGFVLVPNEQASIVQEIFNRYTYGETLSNIARWLNTTSLKPHYANAFTSDIVKKILLNDTYIGKIRSKKEGLSYDGKHEAIIPIDIFLKAQEMLNIKCAKKNTFVGLVNPLAGVLHCGVCGKVMHVANSGGRYFFCHTIDCPTTGASVEKVETVLLAELKAELSNFNYYIDNYETATSTKKASIENDIKLITAEISKREKMATRVCELLEEGIYSKEKYLERVNALDQEIKALKTTLAELQASTFEDDSIKQAIPKLNKVLDSYHQLTPENKNRLIKSMVKRIDYHKTAKTRSLEDIKLDIYLKI